MADDSISRVVYEDLLQLTFLTGCGIPLPVLMGRFLVAIRPRIPARGLWLHRGDGVLAVAAEPGLAPGTPPDLRWRGLAPEAVEGRWVVSVLPEVVLVCAPGEADPQRVQDVLALFARMLALAWQAETAATAGTEIDDWQTAKDAFARRWLCALLERHGGNVAASARAAGLSRMALYDSLRRHGITAADAAGVKKT